MRFAIAPDVGFVERDGVVYAASLPDGPIFILADEAAGAWRFVTQAQTVAPDVEGYLHALVDAKLLVIDKEK